MTLGPEYPELVQRYAGYIQQAKDIEEIATWLIAFQREDHSEIRARTLPDGEEICEVNSHGGYDA